MAAVVNNSYRLCAMNDAPRVQTHTLSGAMICNYERNIAHPLNLQNEARPCLVRCISERTRFYHIKALTESPREPHVRPVAGLASPRDHPSPESALGSALWTTSDRLVSITCIAQCTLTQRGSLLGNYSGSLSEGAVARSATEGVHTLFPTP